MWHSNKGEVRHLHQQQEKLRMCGGHKEGRGLHRSPEGRDNIEAYTEKRKLYG
jgi:hypothetical protein